ncbi:MAG: class I SAM-dependent methyltransferase [Synechococcales bacterium]|nr:class I SAM-dependent methyltransferase [Synechococcales bacterium]
MTQTERESATVVQAIDDAIAVCRTLSQDDDCGGRSPFARACRQLEGELRRMGQVTAAQVWQAWAVEAQPQRAEVWAGLGALCFQLGQTSRGLTCLDQALELEPGRADADRHYCLAQSLQTAGQADRAMACYRRVIRLEPHRIEAHRALGQLLAAHQQWPEAIACYRQVCWLRGWTTIHQRGYEFTHDWFSHHIPLLTRQVRPLAHRPHCHILEVGSDQGMTACWWLEHLLTHPTARLTCVDGEFSEGFTANLTRTGASDRVTCLTGHPPDHLGRLSPHSYDLVYLCDRCHLAGRVRQNAELSWPLLKPGGLLIFAYYGWSNPADPQRDPRVGIHQFLTSVTGQTKRLHTGYQLILQKLG